MGEPITQSEVQTLLESALFASQAALEGQTGEAADFARRKISVALVAAGWVSVHEIDLRAELKKIGLDLSGAGSA